MAQHGRRWVEDRISLGRGKTCLAWAQCGTGLKRGACQVDALQVEGSPAFLLLTTCYG